MSNRRYRFATIRATAAYVVGDNRPKGLQNLAAFPTLAKTAIPHRPVSVPTCEHLSNSRGFSSRRRPALEADISLNRCDCGRSSNNEFRPKYDMPDLDRSALDRLG